MSGPLEPLPEGLPEALSHAEAFPLDAQAGDGVKWIQTHVSHVFLTGGTAYKLHRAVDLGFLRFATREERNTDCLHELRLNRRLAPDVYLGVAPIEIDASGVHLGAVREDLAPAAEDGRVPEHCVVMRRLPDDGDALSRLEAGRLSGADIDRIAARIASFHRANRLGAPAPFSAEEWLERVTGPARRNYESLAQSSSVVGADAVERARRAMERAADALAGRFEARRRSGRAVEGHGDLHLQHVFLADDAEPIVIDCITFDERLRRIDAAAEVAFLAMDLQYRDAAPLASRFLARYAALADDYDLYEVVDFFVSYRAAVRAKVAALAAVEREIDAPQREAAAASARRHLALAARILEPRPEAPLVLVGGPVGTGKSSVAARLAERVGGVVVSSDRTRKHLLGIDPTDRRHAGDAHGAYSDARKRQVYEALLERAVPVARSGRVAVLDATWSARADRDAARQCAAALGVAAWFVEVDCAPDEVQRRVAARSHRGNDTSDAGPEVAAKSRASFEPLDEWPQQERISVRTDREDWTTFVDRLPPALAAAAGTDREEPA